MFSRLLSLLRTNRFLLALTVLSALAGGLLAVGQAAALSRWPHETSFPRGQAVEALGKLPE